MLSCRTTHAWNFTLVVTVAAFPPETYANAVTSNSAYDALEALVAWANDAARAWTGVRTFRWTWARNTAALGGSLITLSATGGTFTIGAGAATYLGLPAAGPVTSVTGTVGAIGTWDPPSQLSLRRYLRHLPDAGVASGVGAMLPGVQGLAHRRPHVETVCYQTDVGRLLSVLALTANPRIGWIYQEQSTTWRMLVLGATSQSHIDSLSTRVSIEVAA